MLETGINIIEWPSLPYCTMSAFGGDALQRKAMSHKSSFIIIDISATSRNNKEDKVKVAVCQLYKSMSKGKISKKKNKKKTLLTLFLVPTTHPNDGHCGEKPIVSLVDTSYSHFMSHISRQGLTTPPSHNKIKQYIKRNSIMREAEINGRMIKMTVAATTNRRSGCSR